MAQLNAYTNNIDNISMLILNYIRITERPPQTDDSVEGRALQASKFQFQTMFNLEDQFEPSSLSKEMQVTFSDLYKSKVVLLKEGFFNVERISLTISKEYFKATLSTLQGEDLHIIKEDDGVVVTEDRMNLVLLGKGTPKVTARPVLEKGETKYHEFLFSWHRFWDNLYNNKLDYEIISEDHCRFSYKRIVDKMTPQKMSLDVENVSGQYLPKKYIVESESVRRIISYEEYELRSGLFVPSLVIEERFPTDQAKEYINLFGYSRCTYSLE